MSPRKSANTGEHEKKNTHNFEYIDLFCTSIVYAQTIHSVNNIFFFATKWWKANPATLNLFTQNIVTILFRQQNKIAKKSPMHIWTMWTRREPTKPHNWLDVSKLHTENPIRFTLSVKTLTQSMYSFLSVCCFMLVEYNTKKNYIYIFFLALIQLQAQQQNELVFEFPPVNM